MANLRTLGVSFEHWCFACGRQNPSGLQLDYDVSRDRATARYTGTQKHQGYDGALHGGVVTALLDETMGWAFFHRGVWGVTGRITVTFKEPVPVGEELIVSGWVARERSRAIETKGELVRASDGAVLAEAQAVFLRMPEERRVELERRYGGAPGDAFVKIRAALEHEDQEDERRGGLRPTGAPAPAPRGASPHERSDAARPKAEREEQERSGAARPKAEREDQEKAGVS